MGKTFLNRAAFLGLFLGMTSLGMAAVGCGDKKDCETKKEVAHEAPAFHGDAAYITSVCNKVNDMMVVSSLKFGNEDISVFDGILLEENTVILSVKTSEPIDYVTKGILAIALPRMNKKILAEIVEKLNKRKYVWPKNFFVAIKQNNYKMKFRYWDGFGEKLDVPLKYEDMPEPYKKQPNPVAKNIDGFEAVTIGNQVWMAENLNTEMEGSVCYEYNPENCEQFGRLYDYKAAIKACPAGWHLPDSTEMEELFVTAGKILTEEISKNHELDSIVQRRYVLNQGHWEGDNEVWEKIFRIGLILTAADTTGWTRGLNYLGFNMKPAGRVGYSYHSSNGEETISEESFNGQGEEVCLWTSSTFNDENISIWDKNLYVNFVSHVYRRSGYYTKCAVRCVKDQVKAKE